MIIDRSTDAKTILNYYVHRCSIKIFFTESKIILALLIIEQELKRY